MSRGKIPTVTLSPQSIQARIFGARSVILVAVALTVVNIAILLIKTGDPILFSVSIPYYLVLVGLGMDNGMGGAGEADPAVTAIGPWTIGAIALAAVILAACMLCWYQSKNRRGWMIGALVLFIVDTLALVVASVVLLSSPSFVVIDLCIHLWIIFLLAFAVRAWNQKMLIYWQERAAEEEAAEKADSDPE